MMTVLVFTFVLLLGSGLKQIMPYVISQQVPLWLAGKAAILLIPFVLAYALPVGMLTAALLVFGRFSADQELIAARASGISLASLALPVVAMSVVVSVVCALLNCEVAPRCRVAFNQLFQDALGSGALQSGRQLSSGQNMQIGSSYSLYVGKVSSDGIHLENVRIWISDTNSELKEWIQAPRGAITKDGPDKKPAITLEQAYGAHREADGWYPTGTTEEITHPIPDFSSGQSSYKTPVSDMTLGQLLEKMKQVEEMPSQPAAGVPNREELRKSLKAMKNGLLAEVQINIHREISFSFACIGFTLVGIPLGIRTNRRETSVGILIALILLAIYYSFVALGLAWADYPERFPQMFLWLPNFIFQAVGAWLLWRANRLG